MKFIFLALFVISLSGKYNRFRNFDSCSKTFQSSTAVPRWRSQCPWRAVTRTLAGMMGLMGAGNATGSSRMQITRQDYYSIFMLDMRYNVFTGAAALISTRQECPGSRPWSAATSTRATWPSPRTRMNRLRSWSTSQLVGVNTTTFLGTLPRDKNRIFIDNKNIFNLRDNFNKSSLFSS